MQIPRAGVGTRSFAWTRAITEPVGAPRGSMLLRPQNERLHRDLDVLTIRARIAENGRDDALGSLARAERRAEELHKQGVGLQRELREAAAAAQQRDEVARVQENRIRVLSEHLARERRAGADARSALAQAQERSSEARAEARESARKLQARVLVSSIYAWSPGAWR